MTQRFWRIQNNVLFLRHIDTISEKKLRRIMEKKTEKAKVYNVIITDRI